MPRLAVASAFIPLTMAMGSTGELPGAGATLPRESGERTCLKSATGATLTGTKYREYDLNP